MMQNIANYERNEIKPYIMTSGAKNVIYSQAQ